MNKKEYETMYRIRKKISDVEKQAEAGYVIDQEMFDKLKMQFEMYVQGFQQDAQFMTTEEKECFRCRYIIGMNFRQIQFALYEGLVCESMPRKKIDRFLKKRCNL